MALWTYWFIAAVAVFVLEMFSGTVYLLVLSAALAGAGFCALLFNVNAVASVLVAAFCRQWARCMFTACAANRRKTKPCSNTTIWTLAAWCKLSSPYQAAHGACFIAAPHGKPAPPVRTRIFKWATTPASAAKTASLC